MKNKMTKRWMKRIKNAFYYKVGMRFPYSKVRVCAMRKLGYKVGESVYFPSDLVITQNFVENSASITLGDRVSIAPRVMLLALSHPNASNIRDFIVTSKHTIIIEDDVWIGAGSVVTKDVEPYTIVVGNPARKIKDVTIDQ